tara:strand:- start:338 stop:724 length:387 start_codon:yes stop_codon:yes gene_type:complete
MSRRHPRRGEALESVAETMAYFSRVAQKPVWFTYDQLWDLEAATRKMQKQTHRTVGKMTNFTFPTRGALGFFCGRNTHMKIKRVAEKINPYETRCSANMKQVRYYAYIHPGQEDMAGVHYNAGGGNGA